MTTRLQSIAVLLMIGAALGATPSLAATTSIPCNQGPADKPSNRAAPSALPGRPTAHALPRVDPAAISRGIFAGDAGSSLDSLGTVTRGSDGSVSETPASDTLRAIFETSIASKKM